MSKNKGADAQVKRSINPKTKLTVGHYTPDVNELSTHPAACYYVNLGLSVIPIRLDGSKAPALKSWKEFQERLPNQEELRRWFSDSSYGIGIVCGEVSGSLEVIDIEHRFVEDGKGNEFTDLVYEADDDLFSKLVIVRTASMGFHLYYRCGAIGRNQNLALKNEKEKYIETRAEGGYVIAPGSPVSVHPLNQPYLHYPKSASFDSIPAIAPEQRDILLNVAKTFNEYIPEQHVFKHCLNPQTKDGIRPGDELDRSLNAQSEIEKDLRESGYAISGSRVTRPGGKRFSGSIINRGGEWLYYNFSTNDQNFEADRGYKAFGVKGKLVYDGDFDKAGKELFKRGYGKKPQKKLPEIKLCLKEGQSIETVTGIYSIIVENLPARMNLKIELGKSDDDRLKREDYLVGIVEKILDISEALGFSFRFTTGRLFVYNTQYWIDTGVSKIEVTSLVSFLASATEKFGLWGVQEHYYKFIEGLCLQFLTSAVIRSKSVRFSSSDKTLINFKNGTLEIDQSGKYVFRQFDKRDFLTYQLSFDYDESASSSKWDRFLDEVLPSCTKHNDEDKGVCKKDHKRERQMILAEYFASCFTNLNLEKCLFLYGSGSNGKSVVFNVISALLGEQNISYCSLELLMRRDYYLASINNKLLNYSSETSPKIDPELLKLLISKAPITVRRAYENPIQMTNYARLAFNANDLPKNKEFIYAFKRRLAIIPFEVTITPSKADPHLADKIIKAELPGVMNWLLEGLDRLMQQGRLTECNLVDEAVDEYMGEGDIVAQWLEDEGWIKDESLKPKECVQLKDLYKDFLLWCKEYVQFKVVSRDTLRKRLEEMHGISSFEYRHIQKFRVRKLDMKERDALKTNDPPDDELEWK